MKQLNITAKIWLSISVFILGFVLLTIVVQVQDVSAERNLRQTSETLFPAAQDAEKADAAFQRVIKGLNQAVIVQDAAALARPLEDGKQAAAILGVIGNARGLSPGRADEA